MKNISGQYQDLKEGKMSQSQFLRNARMMFPNFVTNQNSFEDSVTILKQRGMLNESEAVKGTPDKEPEYSSPTPDVKTKYKKVEQSPEVDEQNGVYPATTLTDIPKVKANKKVKNESDGLEPIKDKDTKNEMKKVKDLKESLQLEHDDISMGDILLAFEEALNIEDDEQAKQAFSAVYRALKSKIKDKVNQTADWVKDKVQKYDDSLEETRFKKGTDLGKKNQPGKSGFAAVAKAGEKEYGSKEAGKRVAGAVMKKVLQKEELNKKLNKVVEKLLKEVLAEKNNKK